MLVSALLLPAFQWGKLPFVSASSTGRIYILNDSTLLSPDKQAPTDIQNLKSLFESDGQTVTLIDAEDLADRSVFNYSQCDLLVLPYGERFPFDALVNYKEYVHDGGKVLTLGGHAFLNLLQDDPGHAAGVSIPSAGGDGTWTYSVNVSGYSAGSQFTVSAWMKTVNVAGNGFAHATYQFYDASGGYIGGEDYARKTGTNDWAKVEKTITVPQGAAALYITFGMYQASGAMYFDKVSLSETGGNKIVYLYDDFEKDNGSRWNKVSYSGNASFPVVEDAPETLTGRGHSLKATSAVQPTGSQMSLSLNANELNSGETYRFSMWMKGEDIDLDGFAFGSIYFYDVSGNLLSFKDLEAPNTSKKLQKSMDWFESSYTFQKPAGTTRIDINLGLYVTSGTAYFDKIEITSQTSGKTVFFEDFEGVPYNRGWKQQNFTSSAVFSLSGDVPAYKYNGGLSVQSDTYTSAYWNRSVPVSLFDTTKTYEVNMYNRVTNFATNEGGFVYNAIRFYNGSTMLSSYDFGRFTYGSGVKKYTFTIPAGTTHVFFEIGLYKCKGGLVSDNFRIKDDQGNTVLFEGFDQDSDFTNWNHYGGATFSTPNDGQPITLGTNRPFNVMDNAVFWEDAMPLFDEEHTYDSATNILPADDQVIFSGSIPSLGTLEGSSAITLIGNNRARWQPLLTLTDADGEVRGTGGAVVHVFPEYDEFYDGGGSSEWKEYAGTSIGFFGVTNQDLFASGNTALRTGLKKLARTLIQDVYLQNVENKWDNYRAGESPEVEVQVTNGGRNTVSGTAEVRIYEDSTGTLVKSQNLSYQVAPGALQTLTVNWANPIFADDFYRVEVTLKDQAGTAIDKLCNGFSIWKEDVIQNGVNFIYDDNYIRIKQSDGSYKAVFASGADDGPDLFIDQSQTGLQWKKDFEQRQDAGLHIYENLQQYPIYQPWIRIFADPEETEKYYRKVDNAVYLSQKYGQIYMMGIAIGNNVAEDAATHELTQQRARELAARYKDVPGLIYYLNGDMISTLSDANLTTWHNFLSSRYSSIAALNSAWGTSYSSFAAVPIDENYSYAGVDPNGSGYGFWGDRKAKDYNEFRAYLIETWTGSLIDEIQAEDPSENPILCEFYRWPQKGFDPSTALGNLTYSNVGNFEMQYTFPEYMQNTDMRAIGKSFGVGEFGKRTHPLFSYLSYDTISSTTMRDARNCFFGYMNMGFAMGTSHMQYWSWKDGAKTLFPWGLRYTGDNVAREQLYWMRNHNLFTRQMEPKDETAKVAVLLPDNTRLSGASYGYAGNTAGVSCIDILQSAHVGAITTLSERALEGSAPIPSGIQAIFYPAAYNPSDAVYNKIKTFVENGGVLYLSGDISYDGNYQRTKASRLQYLAGVSSATVHYDGLNWHRGTNVVRYYDAIAGRSTMSSHYVRPNISATFDSSVSPLFRDENDQTIVGAHTVGQGKVIYSTVPFEVFYDSATTLTRDVEVYRKVLDNIYWNTRTVFSSDNLRMKNFEQSLEGSGKLICLANASTTADYTGVYKGQYTMSVEAGGSSLIWTDSIGQIKGVLNQGVFKEFSTTITDNGCYAFAFARDTQPLITSKQLVVLPQTSGTIRIKTNVTWNSLTASAGQITGADWSGQTIPVQIQDGYLELTISEAQTSKVILISESGTQDSLAQAVVQDLTT